MSIANNRIAPVISGFRALLIADAGMQTAFGGTPYIMRRRGTQAVERVPGIYWSIITQSMRENFQPGYTQWDVWAEGYDAAVQISNAMGKVMHHENTPVLVNGVWVFSQLTDVEEGPDEGDGTMRLINIYHYQPARALTGA